MQITSRKFAGKDSHVRQFWYRGHTWRRLRGLPAAGGFVIAGAPELPANPRGRDGSRTTARGALGLAATPSVFRHLGRGPVQHAVGLLLLRGGDSRSAPQRRRRRLAGAETEGGASLAGERGKDGLDVSPRVHGVAVPVVSGCRGGSCTHE